jgi:hypothetical protein
VAGERHKVHVLIELIFYWRKMRQERGKDRGGKGAREE